MLDAEPRYPGNTVLKLSMFILKLGFPGGISGKEHACQESYACKRLSFDPWVRKIPWRRSWPPTLVFLPGKSHEQRSLGATACKEYKWHDWSNLTAPLLKRNQWFQIKLQPKLQPKIVSLLLFNSHQHFNHSCYNFCKFSFCRVRNPTVNPSGKSAVMANFLSIPEVYKEAYKEAKEIPTHWASHWRVNHKTLFSFFNQAGLSWGSRLAPGVALGLLQPPLCLLSSLFILRVFSFFSIMSM